MADRPVAVVVGAGPGTGAAVARRFAAGGFDVAVSARSAEKLAPVAEEVRAAGGRALEVPADATDEASVQAAFDHVRESWGDPEVLVYNAGAFVPGGILDVTREQFVTAWNANCLGGLLSAQQVLPAMRDAGRGTVIFTGATASLRGSAFFSCLAVGKFGLRALAQSMARELGPQGVHVAHVIVDGMIDTERVRGMVGDRPDEGFLKPDAIAESYWQLHVQHRSAWTHELDLRPFGEKF